MGDAGKEKVAPDIDRDAEVAEAALDKRRGW